MGDLPKGYRCLQKGWIPYFRIQHIVSISDALLGYTKIDVIFSLLTPNSPITVVLQIETRRFHIYDAQLKPDGFNTD